MHVLDRIERHTIEWALQREGGNASAAAQLLGLPTRTLYHRAYARGVDLARFKPPGQPQADVIALSEICGDCGE